MTKYLDKKQFKEGRRDFGSQLQGAIHQGREVRSLRQLISLHPQSQRAESQINAVFGLMSPLHSVQDPDQGMADTIFRVGLPIST